MRNYFGGKQPNIRDTIMLGEDGFLGPYDRILATGDTHHMWLDPVLTDSQLTGPFWIPGMENSEHLHDVFIGNTKPQKLSKNELIDRIHSSGVAVKVSKSGIGSNSKENDMALE